MVEVSLTVGKIDTSLALLLTEDHHLIEFPTLLLPSDVKAGSIVKITSGRAMDEEEQNHKALLRLQDEVLTTFGQKEPSAPVLRVRNVTQTSVVLEWDPIDVATADIISLVLYKNGSKFGAIPTPLKRTATKLSGLSIDTAYTFHLKLSTSSGTYESEQITVKTHKMTDLTGITICVGQLSDGVTKEQLEKTAEKIGAKPLQDQVKLDTTHFVCTEAEGPQFKRAQDLNIPVVRPEWLYACETERRLVGVRAYYLNADPKLRAPAPRSRATSAATDTSSIKQSNKENSIPEVEATDASPVAARPTPRPSTETIENGEQENESSEADEPEHSHKHDDSKVSIKVDGPDENTTEEKPEEQSNESNKLESENTDNAPAEETSNHPHGGNITENKEEVKNLTGSEAPVEHKTSSDKNEQSQKSPEAATKSSEAPLSKSQKKKMKKKAKSAETKQDPANKNSDMDEVDL